MDFILRFPNRQVKVLGLIHRDSEIFFGLVKMTSGLVHPGYSFPERQAGISLYPAYVRDIQFAQHSFHPPPPCFPIQSFKNFIQ